jgi:hypothetical protein
MEDEMSLTKGDRVIATETLGIFGAVRKGTEGAVISEPDWLTGECEVVFTNGVRWRVGSHDVIRQSSGWSW